jgi:hypothetical protein
VCRIESLLCILFTDTIFSVYLKFGNTIAYLDHNLNHCITLLRAFSAVQLLTLFSSRRNMLKEKSGTCTGRSRLLMLVLVFLSIYSLLVENKILHSVKTPLEPLLQDAVATGDTDALPTVAPYAYPTSPSTSGKVEMTELDHNQAEAEIATSQVEQEREDASAEKEAERNNQKENEKELEDPGQAATEVAKSRLELQRQDASAEEEAEQKNQKEKNTERNRKRDRKRRIKCTRQWKNRTLDQLASHPWRPG